MYMMDYNGVIRMIRKKNDYHLLLQGRCASK